MYSRAGIDSSVSDTGFPAPPLGQEQVQNDSHLSRQKKASAGSGMRLFSKPLTRSDRLGRPAAPRFGVTWIAVVFVSLGLIATLAISPLVFGRGLGITILALLAAPFALILLAVGLRRAIGLLRSLIAHLRWWHALWLLIFASALVFRVRGVNAIEQNPVDAWALYRIGLEMIVTLALFIRLALRTTPWLGSMFRGFVGALTVFGLVELASTAWSVYPAWTFYKACEYLLDIALLAAVLATIQSVESYKQFFNWTWTLYGLLLLSVWLGVVLWPQQALFGARFKIGILGARLNGVVPAVAANDVGTFAAILALISLCRLLPIARGKTDRAWYILLFIGSMVTLVFSQTRSAIAGFLFGFFLLLLFSKRLGLSAFLTFVVAPLLLLSSLGGLIWTFLERGQNSQQLENLSSRVQWWSFAWEKFLQRPLLGFGAYAAGRFAVLAKHGLNMTSTMHSDYLEMLVGTGIWGLIPFLVALAGTWWFLMRYLRRSKVMTAEHQLAYEAVAVLGLLTVRSVVQTMLTWHPPLDYLVILGYAEFLRRRRLRAVPVSIHIIKEKVSVPELEAVSR
jgi:O-antigen ligase